jgi:hypothetical protein
LLQKGKKKKENMAVSGSSGSGQPQFISSTGNQNSSNAPLIDSDTTNTDQIVVPDVSFAFHSISFLNSFYFGSWYNCNILF